MQTFDFIIVGGGSAGCVLANRLSSNPDINVLLLEAGGKDTNPYIHMPVGFAKLNAGTSTWGYKTQPQRHAYNREIAYAQGYVLGGGSSINAEVFTRGNPADFDAWQKEKKCDGWGFANVQPYFIKSEGNCSFSGKWHGTDGPLGVSDLRAHPLTNAFVQSCQEIGLNYNPDFNGEFQAGTGVYQTTIKDSRRCSAAVGYLKPVMCRPNLTVRTSCFVDSVEINKNRATVVRYVNKKKQVLVEADKEIIITAGAIGTPKLLMLSGIGSADHLKSKNIQVAHHLPGVGENLQDHFGVDIVAELKHSTSLDKYKKIHWMLWAGLEYALFKSGPVASNVVEGGAFWYSKDTVEIPDLQFHFLIGSGAEDGVETIKSGSGITLNSYTLRPYSRGKVTLQSNNPNDAPLIDPNFLSDDRDAEISARGVELSRDIFMQHSLQKHIKRIHNPRDDVKTRKHFIDFARRYGRTSYHPTCTCKMGKDDMSVVDPQLRVYGVENLRICDSSVMPNLIGSNINATVIMIAEKASDMILQEHSI